MMLSRMRLPTGVALITVFFLVLPAEALLQRAHQAAGGLPEGKGKELVGTVCASCHALDVVTSTRKSRSEWEASVQDMISRGAQMTADEAKTIADYLGEQFGGGAGTSATAAAGEPGAAYPDAPGKDVLAKKCFQCHGEGMWKDLRQDRRKWEGTLYRMVGKGALWTEEEIEAMAQYLTAAFGPTSTEAPARRER